MASNAFIPVFRNENGKRERMDQEDDPDVVPLSKRMNNIHFDGGFQSMQMQALSHNGLQQSHSSQTGCRDGFVPGIPNPAFLSNQPSTSAHSQGIANVCDGGSESQPKGYGSGQGGQDIDHITYEESMHASGQGPPLSRIQYTPVLSQESNPYYYESNRILFELYKERLQRNNLPAHPNYGPV